MSRQTMNGLARGAAAVEYFVRPRSVAIIGLSSRPGSAGMNALANLTNSHFKGNIHLVGRSGGVVQGRKVAMEINELPEGVDLAIFTLPVAGVKEALEGCVRRKVNAVVCFASGFAEIGEGARQDEIAKIARDGGVALLGPNCFGYSNFVDGFSAGFVSANTITKLSKAGGPNVAVLTQSGAMIGHIKSSLGWRGIATSYAVSTGNEAGIGLHDFVEFLARDSNTQTIIIYAESVRNPLRFVEAAHHAQEAGKSVVMMHPGRTATAAEAMNSHTGACTGEHALMRSLVEHSGICLVDSLDQLVDTSEVMTRFPHAIAAGPGILTFSGAFCAIAHDFCEEIGLPIPPLSANGKKILQAALPSFTTPRNPLDLTTQAVWQPELVYTGAKALLEDPKIGSLMISIPPSGPMLTTYLEHVIRAIKECPVKPVIFSVLGDSLVLPEEFLNLAQKNQIVVSSSADRSLRALVAIFKHGVALERARKSTAQQPLKNLPALGKGAQPE